MKMNIISIEDSPQDALLLKDTLNSWAAAKDVELSYSFYSSGEEYFSMKNPEYPDIFFLDIQLAKADGLEVARHLRAEGYTGHIIFLTSYKEYVYHGYDVRALNYFIKPVTTEKLTPVMNEVRKQMAGDAFFFREGNRMFQIPFRNILAFHSRLHYVDILTLPPSPEIYCISSPLNALLKYLPEDFIQCHRSYIVNRSRISRLAGNQLTLMDGTVITIGRKYLEAVRRSFCEYTAIFVTR